MSASRFRNRPPPPPPTQQSDPREQDAINRLAHQRTMRLFGAVLRAVLVGQIDSARGGEIVQSSIAAARKALLDKEGQAHPDMVGELASIVAELSLKGEADLTTLARAASLAVDTRIIISAWEFSGSSFPYSDKASMVATISDATIKLSQNAAGRLDPLRVSQIVDQIWQTSIEMARTLIPGAKSRDIYNFSQSMIKFLAGSIEFPAGAIDLQSTFGQIERSKSQYLAIMQPLAANVDRLFTPPAPAAEERPGQAVNAEAAINQADNACEQAIPEQPYP